ncbi:unnamed protein product [Lota lota]
MSRALSLITACNLPPSGEHTVHVWLPGAAGQSSPQPADNSYLQALIIFVKEPTLLDKSPASRSSLDLTGIYGPRSGPGTLNNQRH